MRTHVPAPLVVTLAALAAVGLSGCSSSPAPQAGTSVAASGGGAAAASSAAPSVTAAAALTTACQLLTKQEAEAVVGTTLSEGVEGQPGDPSCTYDPDPDAAKTAQVRVLVGDGAKKTYDIDVSLDHEFSDLGGAGDEAHQEDSAVFVRKGTLWGGITIVSLDDVSRTAGPLGDAAKVVVSRMP